MLEWGGGGACMCVCLQVLVCVALRVQNSNSQRETDRECVYGIKALVGKVIAQGVASQGQARGCEWQLVAHRLFMLHYTPTPRAANHSQLLRALSPPSASSPACLLLPGHARGPVMFSQLFKHQFWTNYSPNNNNLFYRAPQQQWHELLALYRSTNVIEHTSICYHKFALNHNFN